MIFNQYWLRETSESLHLSQFNFQFSQVMEKYLCELNSRNIFKASTLSMQTYLEMNSRKLE